MLRILIADDHAIVRKGIIHLLLEKYPTAIIGEVSDAEDLIAKVMEQEWDVVISDMSMPGRSGLDALEQIKEISPQLPVLIMSMYPEDHYALRILKIGGAGFLGKETIHDDLIKAVETVRGGRKFITPSIAEKLVNALDTDPNRPLHEDLSNREFDVFKLLAAGKSITDIASQLSLSATTVSTYRTRILTKMNMRTNAELTRYAFENNLA